MTRTTFVVACLAALLAAGSSCPEARAQTLPARGSGAGAPVLMDEGHDIVVGRSLAFTSKALGRAIRLDVALPEGYATGQDRYPVLFAFQNQLLHVQGVVDAMSRAAAAPPMIVVAVGVPGDLFELYARDGKPGPGRAARVLEFLRDELQPFIDASYRTVPYRIVLGHSASALFGLWAAFTAPHAIQALLAAGPMFPDYDYARVADMLETAIARRPACPQFLFVTQGLQPELTHDLAAFRQLLARRRPAGLTVEFDPEPMSNHNSLGIRTLHDGLWTLYLGWSTLPEPVAEAGAQAIRAHKLSLATRFGYDIGLSRLADNHVRALWTAEGRHEKVIALARLGCREWPNDHWRVQQLAVAYEGAGRWKDAASAWESAIAVAKAVVPDPERNAVVARYERRLAEARAKAGLVYSPTFTIVARSYSTRRRLRLPMARGADVLTWTASDRPSSGT